MTSIQKLLGHRRLNSTMIYARVHDRTVAEDYYTAMAAVENQLERALLPAERDELPRPLSSSDRTQLLELALRLAEPQLEPELRPVLVEQIRSLLNDAGEPIPETIDTGGRL